MKSEAELRAQMVEVGRQLWQRGLVGATEGNISCRLGNHALLCTPSGVSKGHISADDLVIIDFEGNPTRRGHPSSEIRLHLRFYRERRDCNAVVHAHPPMVTAFALAHKPIPHGLLPEAVVILGKVALCPFGMPGTEDLPDSLGTDILDHDSFMLSNHGAVTMGSDLMDAFWRMETLERVAVVYAQAQALGGAMPLDAQSVSSLEDLRQSLKQSLGE